MNKTGFVIRLHDIVNKTDVVNYAVCVPVIAVMSDYITLFHLDAII